MASNALDEALADTVRTVTTRPSGTDAAQTVNDLVPETSGALTESISELSRRVDGLREVAVGQTETVGANTQAILQNTVVQSSGGARDAIRTAGQVASGILQNALPLAPLVSAVGRLFRGREPEPPPALTTYIAPSPIHLEAANGELSYAGLRPVSSGQLGRARSIAPAYDNSSFNVSSQAPLPQTVTAPQITVQVQAMDSRSFLDHSHDIARAVREAMLNTHPINDVINDL
ncbi:MAG: hypothetical protein WD696_16505 [Bryobacteraceae bacterium]